MIDKETMDRVKRYRLIRTEEQGIALAREEGYTEENIRLWTPGWVSHYKNTARTILGLSRQIRRKQGQ